MSHDDRGSARSVNAGAYFRSKERILNTSRPASRELRSRLIRISVEQAKNSMAGSTAAQRSLFEALLGCTYPTVIRRVAGNIVISIYFYFEFCRGGGSRWVDKIWRNLAWTYYHGPLSLLLKRGGKVTCPHIVIIAG